METTTLTRMRLLLLLLCAYIHANQAQYPAAGTAVPQYATASAAPPAVPQYAAAANSVSAQPQAAGGYPTAPQQAGGGGGGGVNPVPQATASLPATPNVAVDNTHEGNIGSGLNSIDDLKKFFSSSYIMKEVGEMWKDAEGSK